jgi:hypothetical protein
MVASDQTGERFSLPTRRSSFLGPHRVFVKPPDLAGNAVALHI